MVKRNCDPFVLWPVDRQWLFCAFFPHLTRHSFDTIETRSRRARNELYRRPSVRFLDLTPSPPPVRSFLVHRSCQRTDGRMDGVPRHPSAPLPLSRCELWLVIEAAFVGLIKLRSVARHAARSLGCAINYTTDQHTQLLPDCPAHRLH